MYVGDGMSMFPLREAWCVTLSMHRESDIRSN